MGSYVSDYFFNVALLQINWNAKNARRNFSIQLKQN